MPKNPMSRLDHTQVLKESYDDILDGLRVIPITGTLVPNEYDNIFMTYNGNNDISTVIYKVGATTVCTLTLLYDDANRLESITRT